MGVDESASAKKFSRDADEFVPLAPAAFVPDIPVGSSVPSLGAQLDWWISSLCGHIDALQLQNQKLKDDVDLLKVSKLLDDSKAANRDLASEVQSEVAGAILEKVMEKMPSLVGPVILKSIEQSLKDSLVQLVPELVRKSLGNPGEVVGSALDAGEVADAAEGSCLFSVCPAWATDKAGTVPNRVWMLLHVISVL